MLDGQLSDLSLCVFGFSCHNSGAFIYYSSHKPTPENFREVRPSSFPRQGGAQRADGRHAEQVRRAGFTLTGIIYLLVGICVYTTFGEQTGERGEPCCASGALT